MDWLAQPWLPWMLAFAGALLFGWLLQRGQRERFDALNSQLQQTLDSNRETLERGLAQTHQVVGEVQRGLGSVDKQMGHLQDTTSQLRDLQELLRSPKLRGGIGEFLLGELLAQILPQANFTLQYGFKGGGRVDAVIHVGDRLVPVDAKFPMENFHAIRRAEEDDDAGAISKAQRAFAVDVKRHIEAISTKYIRPDEGTFDFALLYLPAESLYREIIDLPARGGPDLLQAALGMRVVPVSPQSFYAYLQVIVSGLQGLRLEKRTLELLGQLESIEVDLSRLTAAFETLSRHVGHAYRQVEETRRRFEALQASVRNLSLRKDEADHQRKEPPA